MGKIMVMSLDPSAETGAATPFSISSDDSGLIADAAATVEAQSRPWYLRFRPMLGIWMILSLMWGTAVCYNICQRVSMQADMSRDVESDLDQGFVNASCTGAQCGGTNAATAKTQNWSGIASTYIKFGSDEMAESVFGPPAVLLLMGLSTLFVLRRRPASADRTQILN
jgi:hypothetical protein